MIFKDFLFKQKVSLLDRGLDTYALRERVIAKNIANASTPDYRPEYVKFEEFFKDGKKKSHSNDDLPQPEIKQDALPDPSVRPSGESYVNIDKEMSDLAQNQLRFRFASRMVKKYFQGLGSAITGFRE
jgi:flagellar basal-body rod protein FlgB